MVVNSDKNKEKCTQNNKKRSADLSSVSTSANTPIKTILSNVNRTNQQTDFADRVEWQLIRLRQALQRIKFLSVWSRKFQELKSMVPLLS